jgi:type VI secretion system protein ImpJ
MTARAAYSVYWQDGMLMWPHHMQQEERFHTDRTRITHRWNVNCNWGLRDIEWDADAMQNGRLEITRLRARLRDGTLVEVPEDGRLPTLELAEAMLGKDQVTVYVGVAILNEKGANVAGAPESNGESADTMRYRMERFEVFDENDGADPQTLEFRTLNLKLLTDTQDLAGYEVLEIARFGKQTGTPALDVNYIPPLLACDAWKPLADDILQYLYHHVGSRMEQLADKTLTRGITFETHNPGDSKALSRLAVLNEGTAVLNTIAFAKGIHPFTAYVELCRLVGQLAIFRAERQAPRVPPYDHDDLATCFYWVKRYIEEDDERAAYEERAFIGEELRMQVAIEAKWLEPAWQMFVGVTSPLPQATVIDLLTTPGQLDMKIGSGNRVDAMFTRGIPALEFRHASQPPRVLPTKPDLTYFQVNRDSRKNEWDQVKQSLTLAIRVNHNLLVVGPAGSLHGQRILALKQHGAQSTTMQFSLFVVPGEASAE